MPEITLTDQNFDQEVLQSSTPVLVDFWATWCGPCKMQGPIIEELARDFEGKAKVGKLEVDQNPVKAQQYGVMSIPTLAIFKQGKVVWQAAGLQQKAQLTEQLNKILA
jgi:thioredoxin 1